VRPEIRAVSGAATGFLLAQRVATFDLPVGRVALDDARYEKN